MDFDFGGELCCLIRFTILSTQGVERALLGPGALLSIIGVALKSSGFEDAVILNEGPTRFSLMLKVRSEFDFDSDLGMDMRKELFSDELEYVNFHFLPVFACSWLNRSAASFEFVAKMTARELSCFRIFPLLPLLDN